MIYKNLCANLIRHEYIVTTSAKAKAAQPYIEKFLANTIKQNKRITRSRHQFRRQIEEHQGTKLFTTTRQSRVWTENA